QEPNQPKYLWFTRYLPYGQGAGIGRLDPSQPLSASNPAAFATPGFWDAPTDPAVQAVGTRPLDLRIDADGKIVFLEAGAARIGTFSLFYGIFPIFSQHQIPNACVDSSGPSAPNALSPPARGDNARIG